MATLAIRGKFGDFATKGFLGDEVQQLRPSVIQNFQQFFDLFQELNEYAQQRISKESLTSASKVETNNRLSRPIFLHAF
jgi:hypothetical protein